MLARHIGGGTRQAAVAVTALVLQSRHESLSLGTLTTPVLPSSQRHGASLWSLTMNWSVDDNRDDNYSLNYGNRSPKPLLSCLVTAPIRSWQCGSHGFGAPLVSELNNRERSVLYLM